MPIRPMQGFIPMHPKPYASNFNFTAPSQLFTVLKPASPCVFVRNMSDCVPWKLFFSAQLLSN